MSAASNATEDDHHMLLIPAPREHETVFGPKFDFRQTMSNAQDESRSPGVDGCSMYPDAPISAYLPKYMVSSPSRHVPDAICSLHLSSGSKNSWLLCSWCYLLTTGTVGQH